MSFSDEVNKAMGQILGLTGIQASIDKIASKKGNFGSRARDGKMNSGDLLNILSHGWGDTSQNLIEFQKDPSKQGARDLFSESWKSQTGALYGANVGHQLLKGSYDGKKTDAPPLAKKRSAGLGTIAAKRQARDLAQNQAASRRGLGLGGTIATSPLGLQGDGATTTRRRLIGE
jgi:hypothetical protein